MILSRYEFELLAYLEKYGNKNYTVRILSDNIKISINNILKCIEELSNKGLIKTKGSYIEITEKGISALEPYRVKRAVILAAGYGSRMMPATADCPKPMVKVNGIRIIDTLLDALISVGIQDITIVRGYKKESFNKLLDKYPFLKFLDNDVYDKTNNISSIILALDKLDGCYICEADLYITNPEIITKYQYVSNILGSYSLETDDWSFRLNNGYISDYQKGNVYCYNYYGITYWSKDDCIKLCKDFKCIYEMENGKNYFWELIPLVLKKDNYKVEIRQCSKSDIIEIDSYYELKQLDNSYK